MQVTKNKVVAVEYILTDDENQVLDQTESGEPLEYLHGIGNLIPGLESQLEDKSIDDQFKISIPPADAYGERDEKLKQSIPRDRFEEPDHLEVGMQFQTPPEEGSQEFTIVDIDNNSIIVDGNHELAGMTLHFDITIKNVRDATEDEIAHGHAHSDGCHHE